MPVLFFHESGVIPSFRELWNIILTASLMESHALMIISFLISSGPGALFICSDLTALVTLFGARIFRIVASSPICPEETGGVWPPSGMRVSLMT